MADEPCVSLKELFLLGQFFSDTLDVMVSKFNTLSSLLDNSLIVGFESGTCSVCVELVKNSSSAVWVVVVGGFSCKIGASSLWCWSKKSRSTGFIAAPANFCLSEFFRCLIGVGVVTSKSISEDLIRSCSLDFDATVPRVSV